MMQYQTVYISGALDFPESVDRGEALGWAGKSISQQLNEQAVNGWRVLDMNWLSEVDVMVTFQRPASADALPDSEE